MALQARNPGCGWIVGSGDGEIWASSSGFAHPVALVNRLDSGKEGVSQR